MCAVFVGVCALAIWQWLGGWSGGQDPDFQLAAEYLCSTSDSLAKGLTLCAESALSAA